MIEGFKLYLLLTASAARQDGERIGKKGGGVVVSDDINGRRRGWCKRCGQVDVCTACRGSESLAAEPSFHQGQGGALLGRNNRALTKEFTITESAEDIGCSGLGRVGDG